MIAPTPSIGACFAIGEPCGCCGGRCALAGGTPCRACGRELGDGAPPDLRSAVSAIIAEFTPGSARTAASAFAAHVLPCLCLRGIDIDREEHFFRR